MEKIKSILQENGIDASTLDILHGEDYYQEKKEIVYQLTTSGEKAFALWQDLRSKVDKTGFWPILIDPRDADKMSADFEDCEDTAAEIIESALTVNVAKWFSKEINKYSDLPNSGNVGDWAENLVRNDRISITEKTSKEWAEKILVALVPAKSGWETPAYLKIGEWNQCPAPKEHVFVMKYWNELYGAEVVTISYDTVEFIIPKPPTSQEQALNLAKEAYVYCTDSLDGITSDTVEDLAALLLKAKTWFFWWD